MQSEYEKAMAQVPAGALKAITFLDNMSIWLGKTFSWLCVPMVLSLICEVVMRSVFTMPTVWASTIAVMMYGVFYMLASPWCLRDGGHVRTDFFYHNWSVRTRAVADLVHYIFLFFPTHILFLSLAWNFFWRSYVQNETSVWSAWTPIVWPVKFAIPVYVFFTMTQGLSEILKCIYRFKTNYNLWSTEPEVIAVEDAGGATAKDAADAKA